jgi:CubicO group peptidase (beta-lactamase class C family)
MKKILFLFLIYSGTAAFPADVDLESILVKYSVPAIGFLKIGEGQSGGEFLDVRGVRKSGVSTPAKPDDLFHLGSCTKAMTATIIARFVERGLLKWKTPLGELFPDLKNEMHPDFRGVPLDALTAMHSGIAADLPPEINKTIWDPKLNPRRGREFVAKTILSNRPERPPEKSFVYSNSNYIIAAAALERLSGKSWETLIRDELFTPLKMAGCGFGVPANPRSKIPNQPWPHKIINGVVTPVTPDFFSDNPPTTAPAGGVHCALADWAKFIRLHLAGARGEDTLLLKAASFEKLHSPYPTDTYTYGGWIRLSRPGGFALMHTGSNTFNFADVWIFPGANRAALSVTSFCRETRHRRVSRQKLS